MEFKVDFRRVFLISISLFLVLAALSGCTNNSSSFFLDNSLEANLTGTKISGKYLDELIVKAKSNGRDLELIQKFQYIDPKNKKWIVPAKTIVDGASIPKPFWSITGGPFSGKYRDASVVHDFFCETRVRPTKEVHRVFYDAMITSGVEEKKAKVMYFAVARFGPKWESVHYKNLCKGKYSPEEMGLTKEEERICRNRSFINNKNFGKVSISPYNQKEFEETKRLIEAKNFSLDEIESLATSRR
ncbi:MAG: DUF1353 domain-containing protein [Rhodomicrobiaceae bacterium]